MPRLPLSRMIIALVLLSIPLFYLGYCHHPDPIAIKLDTGTPKPIGPYSQAIIANGQLYISGQIAFKPATDQLDTTSISIETKQIMDNISKILSSQKISCNRIIKTTIYTTDLSKFKEINEIYGSYFKDGKYPARETVGVKALPKGAHIEISVIALIP